MRVTIFTIVGDKIEFVLSEKTSIEPKDSFSKVLFLEESWTRRLMYYAVYTTGRQSSQLLGIPIEKPKQSHSAAIMCVGKSNVSQREII